MREGDRSRWNVTMISRLCRRLVRNQRGAALVEFAIVAPVFLLLLSGVIENGVVLFTQSLLDNATRDAARLIQTGQVQQGGGVSAFTTKLCNDVTGYIPCGSLQYNVQAGATFGSLNVTVTNNNGNMGTQGFNAGAPSSDVAVQVAYNRPYIIPLVGQYMSVNGSTMLVSTVIFQNEPYIQ
jgi:Flp pilus assembly protein TadG